MARAAAVLLAAVLLTAACAQPPAPERSGTAPTAPGTVFVGRSADGELAVALAVRDGRATGFVDDGAGLGVWFDGAATDDLLDLAGTDGTPLVGGIHGRVVHGGVGERSFTAVQVTAPAGLYSAEATTGDDRIGWVRFPDGGTSGSVDVDGRRSPAPEMGPGIEVDGVRFTAPAAVTGP